MKKIYNQSQIIDKLENHKLWLESSKIEGEQLILEYCKLEDIDFSGYSLEEVIFKNVDFKKCIFYNNSFLNSNIKVSIFYKCKFRSNTFDSIENNDFILASCSLNVGSFDILHNKTNISFNNCKIENYNFEYINNFLFYKNDIKNTNFNFKYTQDFYMKLNKNNILNCLFYQYDKEQEEEKRGNFCFLKVLDNIFTNCKFKNILFDEFNANRNTLKENEYENCSLNNIEGSNEDIKTVELFPFCVYYGLHNNTLLYIDGFPFTKDDFNDKEKFIEDFSSYLGEQTEEMLKTIDFWYNDNYYFINKLEIR